MIMWIHKSNPHYQTDYIYPSLLMFYHTYSFLYEHTLDLSNIVDDIITMYEYTYASHSSYTHN